MARHHLRRRLLNALKSPQENRGRQSGFQRRRRGRHLCAAHYVKLGARRKHSHVRHQGVIYEGARGHEPLQGRYAARTQAARWPKRWRARTCSSPLQRQRVTAAMVKAWPQPIIFALRIPIPNPYDIANPRGPTHRGHRALGLSQSGQQRSGVPVHLPRRLDVRATTINDE